METSLVVFVALVASLPTMMLCTLVCMYVWLVCIHSSEVEVEVEVGGLPVDRKRPPVFQLLYHSSEVGVEVDSVASSTTIDPVSSAAHSGERFRSKDSVAQLLSTRPPMQLIPARDPAAKKWEALLRMGIRSVTVSDVKCFGDQGICSPSSSFSPDMLVSKIKMEMVVSKNQVEKVIQNIIVQARVCGDGGDKIFLMPVADVIRISTGERGEKAEPSG